jgi:hypothetical protein
MRDREEMCGYAGVPYRIFTIELADYNFFLELIPLLWDRVCAAALWSFPLFLCLLDLP